MKRSVFIVLIASQVIFFILFPIWNQLTDHLHPLVIGVVWFCFTSLNLFIACLVAKANIRIPKNLLNVITIVYSFSLLILLFFRPKGTSYGTINLTPFETIRFYFSGQVDFLIALYNISANIGLFIPFGVYYGYVRKQPSVKEILLITICAITSIEGLQYLTKRGSLDVDDLILNIVGVYIGYFICPLIKKVLIVKK